MLTLQFQTAAALAISEVRKEDENELSKIVSAVKEGFMEKNEDARRHWGGGIMGAKAQARERKKKERAEREIKI